MKIGFTCGAFDLLHSGHIVMLKQAKENCDQFNITKDDCIAVNIRFCDIRNYIFK